MDKTGLAERNISMLADVAGGNQPSLVEYRRWGILPAPAMYVTVSDVLVLRAWSNTTGSTIMVSVRVLTPDGQIVPLFQSAVVLTSTTAPVEIVLQKVEGFLLSAVIESTQLQSGQAYCELLLRRGQGSGDQTTGALLIAGSPSAQYSLSYPQTPCASATAGRGAMLSNTVNTPAAGLDWTEVVPLGLQWIVRSVVATLTTSATVANRQPHFQVLDAGARVVVDAPMSAAQVAATTNIYSWFPGASPVNPTGELVAGIPMELRVPQGFTIRVATTGLQAADQWTLVTLLTEQFPTG